MQNKSKKGFTLVEIMIVVVIIGLLAAMAVPAFQKVRETSQSKAILNNLRQVASAGQQYLLETGATEVTGASLVTAEYLNTINKLGAEDYDALSVSADGGTLTLDTPGGESVVYSY
jgi:type IV pilus assembly protein PilA